MKLLVCTQAVDRKDPILGFFHRWLEELAKHCDEIFVICLREGEHALPENVHVLSLGKEEKRSRTRYLYRFYYYALRYYFKYDAVFVHMNPEYVLLGSLLWKLGGKRKVLWYTHKSVSISLRIASRLVDVICTASPESFRLKRKNVVVTGHGIDMAAFSLPHAKPVDHMRLVTCGRISQSKGIDFLLNIVAQLPKYGVPYRFSIVGAPVTHEDHLYQERLMEKIEQLGLSSFTGFTGEKKHFEIPSILANSDVFLHASTTGSLDKAALEAMAARCVVVSSNDAVRPMLRMIHDGLAVEKPDPELFALAIQRVQQMDEEVRKVIGERSRTMVEEKHSLTTLVKQLVWILQGNK